MADQKGFQRVWPQYNALTEEVLVALYTRTSLRIGKGDGPDDRFVRDFDMLRCEICLKGGVYYLYIAFKDAKWIGARITLLSPKGRGKAKIVDQGGRCEIEIDEIFSTPDAHFDEYRGEDLFPVLVLNIEK